MFHISSLSNIFSSIFYIVVAVLVLLFMVLIHELGHYIAGRILKFKVTEFAVGFGKAIWSKKNKRGEKISLRLFPLGGYCLFEGEGDDDKAEINPNSFNAQKPWKRIIVYIAGPLFNILSAVIFSFILLVSIGYDIPKVAQIDQYYQNASIFRVGDVIYEVGDEKINFVNGNTFASLIAEYDEGEQIVLTIKRNGEIKEITVVKQASFDSNNNLVVDQEGNPVLKLGIVTEAYAHTFGEALVRVVPFTLGLSWIILKGLVMALTFQIPLSQMSGPVGAIGIIAQQTSQSFSSLLVLLPLISVNLGVFNLLPIPALDGSHVVFTTVEWIRRKPINRTVEAYIHFFGIIALLAFVVILDILHLLS